MAVHMDWDWVRGYPIFVYTCFIDHFKFHVKLVKGVKGNQNAPGFGPLAPAWKEYIQEKLISRNAVVKQALKIARRELERESKNAQLPTS
jgi:hypothetical protein